MTPSVPRGVVALAVILTSSLICAPGSLANAACPSNSLFCPNAVISTDPAKSCTDNYSTATYDLGQGSLHVQAAASCGGACVGTASLSASDVYHVGGLPPGTPVTIMAELTASLTVYGTCGYLTPGTASASLTEGESNQASRSVETPRVCTPQGCCLETQNVYVPLRVTIARLSGEDFTLHFGLACSTNQFALADGTLRFSGTPAGATIVSCQGYRSALTTPAIPVSWGALKVRYR